MQNGFLPFFPGPEKQKSSVRGLTFPRPSFTIGTNGTGGSSGGLSGLRDTAVGPKNERNV